MQYYLQNFHQTHDERLIQDYLQKVIKENAGKNRHFLFINHLDDSKSFTSTGDYSYQY